MPYCIMHVVGNRYIVLNRLYKPIGNEDNIWIDYEKFPHVKITKAKWVKISKLFREEEEVCNRVYLYKDEEKLTSKKYIEKLKLVMDLKMYQEPNFLSRAN